MLPRIVTHNLSLKVMAFVGAYLLWAIVPAESSQRETLTSVPVRVQVADPDWSLAGSPAPVEVSVRFSGPTREVIRLVREGTSVLVDIDDVNGTDSVVQLRRDWVVVGEGSGLVVEEIIPATVDLSFERAVSVALPFAIPTRGRIGSGLALAAPLGITPGVVRVRGPARLLEDVDSIPLLPLDLSGITRSGIVELEVDTTGLSELLFNPTTATVGIRLEPATERLLPAVPVETQGYAAGTLDVQPAAVPVSVRGASSVLDAADLQRIHVRVEESEIADLAPGETRRVPLILTGVPALLVGAIEVDSVRVQRPREAGDTGAPGNR